MFKKPTDWTKCLTPCSSLTSLWGLVFWNFPTPSLLPVSLTSLTVLQKTRRTDITNWVHSIARLTQLRKLELPYCHIDNLLPPNLTKLTCKSLTFSSEYTQLRMLEFRECGLQFASYLGFFSNLHTLSLNGGFPLKMSVCIPRSVTSLYIHYLQPFQLESNTQLSSIYLQGNSPAADNQQTLLDFAACCRPCSATLRCICYLFYDLVLRTQLVAMMQAFGMLPSAFETCDEQQARFLHARLQREAQESSWHVKFNCVVCFQPTTWTPSNVACSGCHSVLCYSCGNLQIRCKGCR